MDEVKEILMMVLKIFRENESAVLFFALVVVGAFWYSMHNTK